MERCLLVPPFANIVAHQRCMATPKRPRSPLSGDRIKGGIVQSVCVGKDATRIPTKAGMPALLVDIRLIDMRQNIWQFMRQNWLSNRIFTGFDNIVDPCCDTWSRLTDQPWKIMSIAYRQ